jgi:hypothetical protein
MGLGKRYELSMIKEIGFVAQIAIGHEQQSFGKPAQPLGGADLAVYTAKGGMQAA